MQSWAMYPLLEVTSINPPTLPHSPVASRVGSEMVALRSVRPKEKRLLRDCSATLAVSATHRWRESYLLLPQYSVLLGKRRWYLRKQGPYVSRRFKSPER